MAEEEQPNVVRLYVQRRDLQRLVSSIKQTIYDHIGGLSVTEAIGAIELAKIEILQEQQRL